MTDIDVLTTDELVLIFSFLSLYEKLLAMRVCKTWHGVLTKSSAWSVINFRDKGPAIESDKKTYVKRYASKLKSRPIEFRECEETNYCQFPTNEDDILNFLELYAGVALKEVYLCFVSGKIMDFLRKTCPCLETISFTPAKFLRETFSYSYDDVDEVLYIPPRVRRYELFSSPLPSSPKSDKRPGDPPRDYQKEFEMRDEKILVHLGQRSQLRYLKLSRFCLTASGMQALTEKTSLRELQLLHPNVKVSDSEGYRGRFFSRTSVLDDILTPSVGSLTSLTCFRLDCYSALKRHISQLPNLPGCIGQWKNLKVLALRGVECSGEAFEIMLPGLLNLESLELEGASVTTSAVSLVGQHLKKIKFLEIGNGNYSDDSLQSLLHHPSLEKLWFHQAYTIQNSMQPKWLHAIYDVLVSLPKIKHAKLEGYRLLFLHCQENFPVIESAEIEVDNVSESIPMD